MGADSLKSTWLQKVCCQLKGNTTTTMEQKIEEEHGYIKTAVN